MKFLDICKQMAGNLVNYYRYKLHAVYGLSDDIHSFNLTKASIHDIHYPKHVIPNKKTNRANFCNRAS